MTSNPRTFSERILKSLIDVQLSREKQFRGDIWSLGCVLFKILTPNTKEKNKFPWSFLLKSEKKKTKRLVEIKNINEQKRKKIMCMLIINRFQKKKSGGSLMIVCKWRPEKYLKLLVFLMICRWIYCFIFKIIFIIIRLYMNYLIFSKVLIIKMFIWNFINLENF